MLSTPPRSMSTPHRLAKAPAPVIGLFGGITMQPLTGTFYDLIGFGFFEILGPIVLS